MAKIRCLGLALLCFFFVALAGFAAVAWHIASFGEKSFDGQADAAVILGAAAWGNQPSPVYRERINEAITRYRNKQVRYMVFTGGTPDPDFPSEGEVGRAFALKQGIPSDAILVDTTSRTTWQNLVNARQLLAPLGLHKVLLISDPLHMRRAMAMAEDLDFKVEPGPTSSSRFQSLSARSMFLWRETWTYLGYIVLGRAH